MTNEIIAIIKQALQKNNLQEKIDIILTKPKGHSDYATNVAMQIAAKTKESPIILANAIKTKMKSPWIKKVEVVGVGYINIFLSTKALNKIIENVLTKNEKYGAGNQGKYINVEYVSANPTGFLHLGHARGAAIGSSLAKILCFAGNRVDTDYYLNDMGNQINILGQSTFIRYQNIVGNKDLKLLEDSYKGGEIIECAKFLASQFGAKYKDVKYEKVADVFKNHAKKYMLDHIKKHLKSYHVVIDKYVSESSVYKSGAIAKTLAKIKNYTYKKDGALWINTTKMGDDKDRVLIKSDQSFTYFLPDLTYHNDKIERGYDELINVWGSDHIGYIKRMEIGIGYLGLSSDKVDTLVVQTVKLFKNNKELKMSKRKGDVFTLNEIIEKTGVNASRWFMLDRACNSQIVFDLDKALAKSSNNPIFTIQYTHARINQLLQKSTILPNPQSFNEKIEKAIISQINDFPNVIIKVATNHKIHLLAKYVFDLTKLFNSWYSTTRAIGDPRESSLIALAKATQIVIKTSLDLFGIEAPNKM